MHNSPALCSSEQQRPAWERGSQQEEPCEDAEAQAVSLGLTELLEYVVSFATLLIKLQEVMEKTFVHLEKLTCTLHTVQTWEDEHQ